MRIRHYWRKHLVEHVTARTRAVTCDAATTVALLSKEPQEALGWFSRFIAFLTTPFKRIGISGWKETGCAGKGSGRPVRSAQHSTDGFYTIDVLLEALTVGAEAAPADRYLRLRELWIGHDFAMGYQREGDAEFLTKLGQARGFASREGARSPVDLDVPTYLRVEI